MPLFKSKSNKAVGENIKAESDAGKPRPQALAIALSVQRNAKKKKMFKGGDVDDTTAAEEEGTRRAMDMEQHKSKLDFTDEEGMSLDNSKDDDSDEDDKPGYADGGEVEPAPADPQESVAKTIMRTRGGKRMYADSDDMKALMKEKYSAGGEVSFDEDSGSLLNEFDFLNTSAAKESKADLEANSEESPNQFNRMNRDAANEEQYDDSQISSQPLTSKGHSEQDEHDLSLVRAIRAKMMAKRGA